MRLLFTALCFLITTSLLKGSEVHGRAFVQQAEADVVIHFWHWGSLSLTSLFHKIWLQCLRGHVAAVIAVNFEFPETHTGGEKVFLWSFTSTIVILSELASRRISLRRKTLNHSKSRCP